MEYACISLRAPPVPEAGRQLGSSSLAGVRRLPVRVAPCSEATKLFKVSDSRWVVEADGSFTNSTCRATASASVVKVCSYSRTQPRMGQRPRAGRMAGGQGRGSGFTELSNGFASCDEPAPLLKIYGRLGPAVIEAFAQPWLHRLPMPLTRDDERSD